MRNKTHLRKTLLLLAGGVLIALVMGGCGQQNETRSEVDEAAVDTAATAVVQAGLNSEELKVLSARIDAMIDDAQEAEAEAAALAEAETETATEEAVAETETEATDAAADAGDDTPAEEESSEPAGVGILMLLVGLGSVVIVGLVRFDRENYRGDEDRAS
jgi:hypothetical protein